MCELARRSFAGVNSTDNPEIEMLTAFTAMIILCCRSAAADGPSHGYIPDLYITTLVDFINAHDPRSVGEK